MEVEDITGNSRLKAVIVDEVGTQRNPNGLRFGLTVVLRYVPFRCHVIRRCVDSPALPEAKSEFQVVVFGALVIIRLSCSRFDDQKKILIYDYIQHKPLCEGSGLWVDGDGDYS